MAEPRPPDAESDFSADQYVPKRLHALTQGLRKFHVSKEDADLLIKCGDDEWAVHKAIVRSQWPFVDKALRNYKEGNDGVVYLKEDDPKAVAGLIEFLYTFDYSADGPAMIFDIHMFIIADKYLIHPLADLALRKFEHKCQKSWSTPNFVESVCELYTVLLDCTEMKKIVIRLILENADVLLDEQNKEEFDWLHKILETTALGADVARARISKAEPRGTKAYMCVYCQAVYRVDLPKGSTVTCPADWCQRPMKKA